jgi:hypothetical protein
VVIPKAEGRKPFATGRLHGVFEAVSAAPGARGGPT